MNGRSIKDQKEAFYLNYTKFSENELKSEYFRSKRAVSIESMAYYSFQFD